MLKSKFSRFVLAAAVLPLTLVYWPTACSAPSTQLQATGPASGASGAPAETLRMPTIPANGAAGILPHPAFAFADSTTSSVSIADIAERVTPSVVSVTSERMVEAQGPMLPFLFGPPGMGGPQKQQGLGSGVIISAEGIVLTNHHVIEDATQIKVTTSDDRVIEAQLVGSDKKSDLAVLRLKGDLGTLKPLAMGDSAGLRLGDVVLAVGNPFGVGQTVTMGIVSAKGRSNMGINDYEDFIQTDAAINPGNSGGALVNMKGELVGINTAILSRSGGYQGIGFAIPTHMAQPIADSLLSKGRVVRGFLGIGIQDLDPELARALKLQGTHGALVTDVQPGGAADKAGVKVRDVIVAVNGAPVDNTGHLRNLIAAHGINAVTLDLVRDGKASKLQVALAEMPEEAPKAGKDQPATAPTLGMKLAPLDDRMRQHLRLERGAPGKVVVVGIEPQSRAADAGLRPGDVLLEIDQKPVTSVQQVEAVAKAAKGPILIGVRRGEGTRYLVVKP